MRDAFRRVGVLSIWYRSIRHFIFRFIFEQPTRYFKLIASHKYKQLQQKAKNIIIQQFSVCIRQHIYRDVVFLFCFILCCASARFSLLKGGTYVWCCYCISIYVSYNKVHWTLECLTYVFYLLFFWLYFVCLNQFVIFFTVKLVAFSSHGMNSIAAMWRHIVFKRQKQ